MKIYHRLNQKLNKISFLLSLLILGIIGVFVSQSLNKSIENTQWVEHTYKVILALNNVANTSSDSASGRRGFIITRDPKFLAIYDNADKAQKIYLQEVKKLLEDDPIQEQKLEILTKVINKKKEILDKALEAKRHLKQSDVYNITKEDIEITRQAQIMQNDIEDILQQMQKNQGELLIQRNLKEAESIQQTQKIFYGGYLLSFLILGVGFLLLNQELKARHQMEKLLTSNNDNLEKLVAQRTEQLAESNLDLEKQVEERTSQLSQINQQLTKEIKERLEVDNKLQEAYRQMKLQLNELESRNFEINLLSEISDLLQASLDLQEAYIILQQVVPSLFPNLSGAVFIYYPSKDILDLVSSWGEKPLKSDIFFMPKSCWGIRRGHFHLFSSHRKGIICPHIHRDNSEDSSENQPKFVSICIPMMAHGETLGILYLYSSDRMDLSTAEQNLATTVAEHIALGLANLRLRETLENQSIKDPLTELYNRRFLENYLAKEFRRAELQKQNIGLIIIDFDHFKQFNDTFGHDAGDLVLKKISDFLRSNIRKSDIACRYGGEELVIVMPESSLEETRLRAERLREGVKNLSFSNTQYNIDRVTISLGVSVFPEHGLTTEEVLIAADKALYQAKAQGRDRVVVAE